MKVIIISFFLSFIPVNGFAQEAAPVEAQGLWRLPTSESLDFGTPFRHFRLDGSSVTLQLLSEHEYTFRTADDYWRVEARWNADELQYRAPFGDWYTVAYWVSDHFQAARDDPAAGSFSRVEPAALAGEERALVRARELHDYSTTYVDPHRWWVEVADWYDGGLDPFPGLYERRGDEIIDAPEADAALVSGYATWAHGEPASLPRAAAEMRLSINTNQTRVALHEPVRVLHVAELAGPDSLRYVMGPKAIFGEVVDRVPRTGPPIVEEYPWIGIYDGLVMHGPGLDINFDITTYTFDSPGPHEIFWQVGELCSNTLVIEVVEAD